MDFRERIREIQKEKDSLACVGLDSSPDRLPSRWLEMGFPNRPDIAVLVFNMRIVDETAGLALAYKLNPAFYEAMGLRGLKTLQRIILYIHNETDIPVILDVKRGGIGSTAQAYAQAAFEVWGADAVTVNPYMGRNAVEPFLQYAEQGKGVFVLGQTSNPSAGDFQTQQMKTITKTRTGSFNIDETTLSRAVVSKAAEWKVSGVVVGATIDEQDMQQLRKEGPQLVWLMPGIGAQGGDPGVAIRYGFTQDGIGPIVNSSRGIICNWKNRPDLEFDEAARIAAQQLQGQLNELKGAL